MAMTSPTIALGVLLSFLCWDDARESLRAGPSSGAAWLILGVFFGFTGESLDNSYWAVPWTCSFLGLDITDTLMALGVYFNIPFRQSLGVLSSYCHVRGIAEYAIERGMPKHAARVRRWLNRTLVWSSVVGVCYSLLLIVIKQWIHK